MNESLSESKWIYEIQAINVPHEVNDKLIIHGFSNAIFYVGSSEDPKNVTVLDGPPTMEMIQFTDYNGNEREYMSGIISL